MSTWDEDLAAAAADLFEFAGRPATWDGTPITVLEGQAGETNMGNPGPAGVLTLVIQVREVEIGGPPRAGAAVVYQGRTWRATPFPTGSAGIWQVALNQQQAVTL